MTKNKTWKTLQYPDEGDYVRFKGIKDDILKIFESNIKAAIECCSDCEMALHFPCPFISSCSKIKNYNENMKNTTSTLDTFPKEEKAENDTFPNYKVENFKELMGRFPIFIKDENVRSHNIGKSNYSQKNVQPWDVWIDWELNPWDADIVKRVCRTKTEPGMTPMESRRLDYEKIIHVCQERIRQIDEGIEIKVVVNKFGKKK